MIRVENLSLFAGGKTILDNVSLNVRRGETLAIIGASSAGKSSLAHLLLGLQRLSGKSQGYSWLGRAFVGNIDVLQAKPTVLKQLRGRRIGLIVQKLSDALNPQLTVRTHITEMLAVHQVDGLTPETVCNRFNIPARLLDQLPHALSGGECQRVLTALALIPGPDCLILDEPSASLDAVNRAIALETVAPDRAQRAQILISHDIHLVEKMANRIAVMDKGRIVETGSKNDILRKPAHAITRSLFDAIGSKSLFVSEQSRCGFMSPPRGKPTLKIESVGHTYGTRRILKDVCLCLHENECVTIQGQSGVGKSTLGRLVAGLTPTQEGQIFRFGGTRNIGYISQFPHRSIGRHFSVSEVIAEAIRLTHKNNRRGPEPCGISLRVQIVAALRMFGLPDDNSFLKRKTHILSGGEAQRLCLARAFAMKSSVLVADEPTSALDFQSKKNVLNALARLKAETPVSMIIFSHDIELVSSLADRSFVLSDGHLGAVS